VWTIIRRNAFWYFTHLITFGFPLFNFVFNEGRRGYLVYLTFMAPVWLCSSVLWSERIESYAFLRMLPVRDGDIARAKLRLGLAAVVVYWLLLLLYSLLAWGASPAFAGRLLLDQHHDRRLADACHPQLPRRLAVWRPGHDRPHPHFDGRRICYGF